MLISAILLPKKGVRSKKAVLFPKIGRVKFFLSLTRPHSQNCIRMYILCFTKKTHAHREIHTNKKEKKLKKLAGCKF